MEKNSINNHQHQHRNRERIGVLGQFGDHHDDGLLRTTTTTQTPETRSSDFVLQWGNRKRLRCMKIQVKVNNTTDSSSAAVPVHRTTVRVDRRVIRSDTNNNNNRETSSNHPSTTASNGYLNLRQRPPSPSHRILSITPRNSESLIAMKGQSNGVKGVTSPDRGGAQDKMGSVLHNNSNNNITVATTTTNNNNNNNNSNNDNGGRGGGSGAWEGAQDSKKGGNSSGSDGMPVVWPPKFVIGLTNKEKEEDFFAFKGSKLPQRPKKRAKFIQRTLNLVSPGAWLCDLTLERYEVREKKISKKRAKSYGEQHGVGLRIEERERDRESFWDKTTMGHCVVE
ncbi:unnamed protein product [Camellia sinensis]